MSRTPTGVETPDVIDLRKAQRKEPEKQLYQVHIMNQLWLMLCNVNYAFGTDVLVWVTNMDLPLDKELDCVGFVAFRFWRKKRSVLNKEPFWERVIRTCLI